MINLTSILNDLLGAAIVVAALIAVAVIIELIVLAFGSKKSAEGEDSKPAAPSTLTRTELNLINVDEKTAALIMAIVSHESEIPLSELAFTSIKLV
jgi:hypothetical protein